MRLILTVIQYLLMALGMLAAAVIIMAVSETRASDIQSQPKAKVYSDRFAIGS